MYLNEELSYLINWKRLVKSLDGGDKVSSRSNHYKLPRPSVITVKLGAPLGELVSQWLISESI